MSWNSRLQQQHGVVLLLMLLVLFISGTTFLLTAVNDATINQKQEQRAELRAQMQSAKERLLAFAANSHQFYSGASYLTYTSGVSKGPGFFPCPDTNNDGLPENACNPSSNTLPVMGRLPAKSGSTSPSIDFSDRYSGTDQQFWYVVAPRYVYHSTTASSRRANTRTTNADNTTTRKISWNGIPGYVALLIAPGEALSMQSRTDANRNNPIHYIESQGAGANRHVFANDTSSTNDMVLGITHDEYMRAVGATIASQLKARLDVVGYPTSVSGSQTNFRNSFPNNNTIPFWLRNTTSNNTGGERWISSSSQGITYSKDAAPNSATLTFTSCSGMTFTISSSDVVRNGERC